MHRIDVPTAVVALPAPSPAGAPGYFTSGDPAVPLSATIPGPHWFNAVQEEIAYVIEQAGIVLDKTNRTQLRAALLDMIGGGVSGYATEAWVTAGFDPLGAAAAALATAEAYAVTQAAGAQANAEAFATAAIAAIPHALAASTSVLSAPGGGTVDPTVSFTPSGPGVLLAFGSRVNSAVDTAPGTVSLNVNAGAVDGDSSTVSTSHFWAGVTAGGAAVTADYSATATVQIRARVMLVFIPYP